MGQKALVLFSGGQDSTTCLYWALKKFGKNNVEVICFDYGQRHKIELLSAKKIAKLAGVTIKTLTIPTFSEIGNNALTGNIPVMQKKNRNKFPNTFVPGRNLIFLSLAAAYAYDKQIRDLIVGVSEADYSGYPDCRNKTIKALALALSLGMDTKFTIHTPLINKSKRDTVLMAKKLGAFAALRYSHTCYNGKNPPCGACPACVLRAKGFLEAAMADPLLENSK